MQKLSHQQWLRKLYKLCIKSSKGIKVIYGDFWALVSHKIDSAHVMASVSFDTYVLVSIDTLPYPRQLPLASQAYHSSVKQA